MTNLLSNISPMSYLDFDALPTSAVILSPDDIDQAAEISNQIFDESKQWQAYLNCLALSAFEQWLEERAEGLTINREKCTILQPALANFINSVANLQVGEFKVCLIATGSLSDEIVSLPRVVVDLPEFIPHFYVLVEVLEEQEAANVYAFLPYQELREITSLQSDWNYQLPISCFDENPDRLLLYLRCLEPSAISLPAIPTNRSAILANIQNQLVELLPQLQSPRRELSEVLTWEQASAVFTNPELLNWLYTLQKQNTATENVEMGSAKPESPGYFASLQDLIKLITQPALNAGRWLWDELDDLALSLSWVLLPSFADASEMRPIRSPEEEFEVIVTQLRQRGLEIPVQARGAYQDFLLAGIPLRMYAVTWHLVSESGKPEWSLLLILGAPALSSLPSNIKFRVSDQTGILDERGLNAESEDSYIFTRVVGNWDEKFLVSVSLMDDVEVTLPPFAFDLGR
ncbi:DUF1822 family protein [Nostoc favosum]|uniref:DUF1822 family protein n=1 Tax=Nostoc favosum CHAB5714 TaxID=2780399 RepID=A0ABS8IA57_9NOSO|nr:DUF1822 family protein [Nostoc favosum]MCC5600664.1 DUF1822 family protein [Nostoc favosum CHAB5714]